MLLKTFQHEGNFLLHTRETPEVVLSCLAEQLRLPAAYFAEVDWSLQHRSHQRHRQMVMVFCGFRPFDPSDEARVVQHLTPLITDLNPEGEALRQQALEFLRAERIVPPQAERLRGVMRLAILAQERHWTALVFERLPADTRLKLDALINTDLPDESQPPLLVIRSPLAQIKDTADRVKVETVLEEVQKLRDLRSIGLPAQLFDSIPPKVIHQYRRRAASEPPRELRRHLPPAYACLSVHLRGSSAGCVKTVGFQASKAQRLRCSKLARPYRCRLISLSLVTWPSVCPLLHADSSEAKIAARSCSRLRTKRPISGILSSAA